MRSKATVSRVDYHAAHRGPQREARVSNASEKATHKYRIMHNRGKKGGRKGEGALKLVAWFSLPSPSFSPVSSVSSVVVSFALRGILFPASCLKGSSPASRTSARRSSEAADNRRRRGRGRLLTPGGSSVETDPAQDVRAVDLHPDIVAPGPQLYQLQYHLRIRPEVQLDLVADRYVLDVLGGQEAESGVVDLNSAPGQSAHSETPAWIELRHGQRPRIVRADGLILGTFIMVAHS